MKEPSNRVDFSNTTGATVECAARGSPTPDVFWVRADGSAVGDVPGLRQVQANGNLLFPPFRAEDYRQEVHAQVYACLARNSVGTIHSRDVNVRAGSVLCEDETIGPIFMKEPSNRVDFSNTTGATVECAARGSPTPDVFWVRADGSAVGDVPGLRQVQANGNLLFPPFRAEDYRQEVHAQVYACLARNSVGTIHSRDVNVRAVVQQQYESEVNNEYVIRGNSALLKCSIPSFVADFVTVESWHDEAGNSFVLGEPKNGDVVTQYYEAEVVSEYVIRGNAAILKCNIPSFVADFVKVEAWVDSDGGEYLLTDDIVVNQFYEAEILKEYVIRGNAAVLKCSIPSFVADFVKVEAWIDEEGTVINHSDDMVVSQYYVTEAENEYVIRGNAAIVHCKIPSFVSDFVYVETWIMDDGQMLTINNTNNGQVVSQPFEAEADNEYVIRGNAALMKCEVPSFVSDFVYVEMWMDSEGGNYYPGNGEAVLQAYEARVNDEFVLRGNTAILKCIVPSFVADFVHVQAWIMDNDTVNADEHKKFDSVVHQNYEPRVIDEDVLRGNSVIVKCSIPSFVADYVQVVEWVANDDFDTTYSFNGSENDYVVSQSYTVNLVEENVLRGNAAIVKCLIPSFVTEYVSVASWIISEGDEETEIKADRTVDNEVVSQAFTVNLMEESVLRGNAAILKCHISTFVTEYVTVSSWIVSEGDTNELEIKADSNDIVVSQAYTVNLMEENVLRGNSAIVKCHIPSFVTEYVTVSSWIISEGDIDEMEIKIDESYNLVVSQSYTVNLWEENVLRGNAAILKCHIPSFVTEYVTISSWIISEGEVEEMQINLDSEFSLVVSQAYDVKFWEEYVLRGNAAILKCQIPSFVSEYVSVNSWIISEDDKEEEIKLDSASNLVVSQAYAVNLMEEYVLRGNSAILKCHIPSFVSEYVTVNSWIVSEGSEEVEIKLNSGHNYDEGKYLVLPSGELHIRDVGPEDGYKSYQCRTKHRLTGETRLSATKGRLVITEPVGRVPPKFATVLTGTMFEVKKNESYALQCPAQAFPTPLFSSGVPSPNFQVGTKSSSLIINFIAEPMGKVSPKFPSLEKSRLFNYDTNQSMALLCPAQAFPTPMFRTHGQSITEVSVDGNRAQLYIFFELMCDFALSGTGFPHSNVQSQSVKSRQNSQPVIKVALLMLREVKASLFCVQLKLTQPRPSEPIGSKSPSFSSISKLAWFEIHAGPDFALTCPAQGFPVPAFSPRFPSAIIQVNVMNLLFDIVEPVGSKSPTFSNDVQFSGITRRTGQDFALLCQAQAFPVPIFRLKLTPLLCSSECHCITLYFFGLEPVTARAPAFPTSASSYNYGIEAHSGGSMLCQAQGYPQPSFRWVNAGLSLTTINMFLEPVGAKAPSFSTQSKGKPTNKIAPRKDSTKSFDGGELFTVTKNDAAFMTCQVAAFPAPVYRVVSVITEPTNKIAPRKDSSKTFEGWEVVTVPQKDVAFLTCQVAAFPAPLFRWYKFVDGTTRKQPVTLNDRVKQVSGTLIIKEAKVEDSGKYLCVVNNSVGGESVETVLTVTAPLKATVEPATQTVDFGRPAVFTCRYEGNPVKTITWFKDGKDMKHHDALLRIESVKKEDKGMYQCFIRNDQESAGASAELKLGGRFEPPLIRHSFGEQTFRSGPSLCLKCVASGNPTPDITWLLDGEKMSSGERLQIGQFVTADGNVESHLNISSVHTNDGGLYTCSVSSKVGSASHSARVNIYGQPYVRPMKKRPVVAGDTLIAHCPVAGYPIDSIVWERDGRVLPINRKQKVFPNGTLLIENVERLSDEATYTCVAKNSQGYAARGTLELQVMVPPQITPFEFGEEILNEGETASVSCVMSKGDLPVRFKWLFNGEVIKPRNNLGVVLTTISKKTSILNIEAVRSVHRGSFTCEIKNDAGETNHTTLLSVNGSPPRVLVFFLSLYLTLFMFTTVPPQMSPFEFGDEPANAGDTVSVQCVMNKGDLPANFSWSLNGRKISQVNALGIVIGSMSKKMSILNIDSVNGTHRGVYVCHVQNLAGHVNHSATLEVNGYLNILRINVDLVFLSS
ncbi:Dscam [Operophtera brumata]|uniref:Hemolin n=1 Tax=Operophtera brumata TaxID=104452 RepID=A0A0L7LL52_OPEBR|nr:Dscam [Operophtera brumata]